MEPSSTLLGSQAAEPVPDAQLLRWCRQPACCWARQQLLLRYWPTLRQLIAQAARRCRLAPEDRLDVQQEAVFFFLEAVERFNPSTQIGANATGQAFGEFLQLIVQWRFIDFVRDRRRCPARLRRRSPMPEIISVHGERRWNGQRLISPATYADQQPLGIIAQQETQRRLEAALRRINAPGPHFWNPTTGESCVRALAAVWGVSLITAKRRRRRLLTRLAEELCNGDQDV